MRSATTILLLALFALPGLAQEDPKPTTEEKPSFEHVGSALEQKLEASLAELAALRAEIASDSVPLARSLSELESELTEVRAELQEKTREVDTVDNEVSRLRSKIEKKTKVRDYLSELFAKYVGEFSTRIHISELQRYAEPLETARLAPENKDLSEEQVFAAQATLVSTAIDRLHELVGGTTFDGTAVDEDGVQHEGTFALVGPICIFRAKDGSVVGLAETRINSAEPTIIPFPDAEDAKAAGLLVTSRAGSMPLDPTQGNAIKMASVEETFLEHVQKGGPVMIPIGIMAGLALLIALYKWLSLSLLRKPSKKQMAALMVRLDEDDHAGAQAEAEKMRGPAGAMLASGAAHLGHSRELIEEVMYETVLTTRLKLQRLLPFVAICAASAPLLGLLGTVTGIINTFKMITVYGSGDVKSLSGGISEALITTKFGLIVAIPSLLLHAFLSRKARGIVGHMESTAINFVNRAVRRAENSGGSNPSTHEDSDELRVQVDGVFTDHRDDGRPVPQNG